MSKLSSARDPRFRQFAAQFNWGVLDQALSSGTNFIIAFALVRRVGPSEFGAFSLGVIIYIISIGVARALNTQPLTISSEGSAEQLRAAASRAFGIAAILGSVAGVLCLAAASVVAGPMRSVLVVLGLSLPLLLVQDAGRVLCFALKQPRTAALNDAAWAVLMLALLIPVLAQPAPPLWALVASWLGSGALAGMLIVGQLRVRPTIRGAVAWLIENRALNLPLVGAHLLTIGPAYLVFALAPAVSSLSELGLARAAYIPFAIFGVLLQSVWLLLLSAAAGKDAATTWRLAVRASAAMSALALIWAVVIALLPSAAGSWLIGDAWSQTQPERLIFGCSLVALAACTGPLIALQSLKAPKRLLRVRLVTTPLVLGGGLLLASAAGAVGIATGILLGDVTTAMLSWHQLHRLTSGERRQATVRQD
jgi:hypothetical protein